MRRALLLMVLLLAGCSADIDVATEPTSETVPVTSIAQPVYAEVAIDVPNEAQGAADLVTVNAISADLSVVNPARSTTLELGMRLSFTGQAVPGGEPVLYTNLNLPPYFDQSIVLVQPTAYGPGTTTPVHITDPALTEVPQHTRIYLIVSNTVTALAGLDQLPIQITLKDIVLNANVTKDFSGLQGGTALGGL